MTGTIWWLWLGCTGLGVLLTLLQMFYAVQKSFGIFNTLGERTRHSRNGRPRLSAEKSIVDSPKIKEENLVESFDIDADSGKLRSSESDSEDSSDVLDYPSSRPLRWIRACSCKVTSILHRAHNVVSQQSRHTFHFNQGIHLVKRNLLREVSAAGNLSCCWRL